MKKKQSKKKTQFKKKKNYSEKTAFSNLKKPSNTVTTLKRSSSGIPKYVADRMARRIFFTAGIPTILGMSVFVVSYIIVTKNIATIELRNETETGAVNNPTAQVNMTKDITLGFISSNKYLE